jgi:hypothetical protein
MTFPNDVTVPLLKNIRREEPGRNAMPNDWRQRQPIVNRECRRSTTRGSVARLCPPSAAFHRHLSERRV